MERYESSQGSYHLVNTWSQNENILTINNQPESWIMNPESSLKTTKRCPLQKQTDGFLLPVMCFSFPNNFLLLLSEIIFLPSPPHLSNPSLYQLRGLLGSGEAETLLGAGREKGQRFSGGKQCPGRLLCMTSGKFPNTALSHFPTEIASSSAHWVTTTGICDLCALPSWG